MVECDDGDTLAWDGARFIYKIQALTQQRGELENKEDESVMASPMIGTIFWFKIDMFVPLVRNCTTTAHPGLCMR